MNRPVLGILGGVGPMATALFMELVIAATPAERDQDHIPMVIINDPQIPDRTAYILGESEENPTPELVRVARMLEDSQADFIAIPCNTAHYFYDAINDAVDLPVFNIMEETSNHIASMGVRRVGLLATEGTVKSCVFQENLRAHGIELLVPDKNDQDLLTSIIYDSVKSNRPYNESDFLASAEHLMERGCELVIVGCTELSVVLEKLEERPHYFIDALEVLANRCVEYYLAARADS